MKSTNHAPKILGLIVFLFVHQALAGNIALDSYGSPAYLAFSATNYTSPLGSTTVTLKVTRTSNTAEPTSLSFQTSDDTAIAGRDYVSTSGTIDFNPGETSKDITVQVSSAVRSSDIAFKVSLFAPTYSGVITRGQATVTLQGLPKLVIVPKAGGVMQVSWMAAPDAFVVETCSQFVGGNWVAVTDMISAQNGQNTLLHTCEGALQFFRLRARQ
ncbi:MAG: hypothetical protein JWN25_2976 [Verrucomicrobiales bacterium]|nr:hypothetical protein [Verrucomicrobiales bacterium]